MLCEASINSCASRDSQHGSAEREPPSGHHQSRRWTPNNQRVNWIALPSISFRLEGLDWQTVQVGGPVQHYRVTFQYIFKDIPDDASFCQRVFRADFTVLRYLFQSVCGWWTAWNNSAAISLANHTHVFSVQAYHDNRTTGIVQRVYPTGSFDGNVPCLPSAHRSMISTAAFLLLQHLIYGCYRTMNRPLPATSFSLRRITSGALISSSRFKRLVTDDNTTVESRSDLTKQNVRHPGEQGTQFRRNNRHVLHHHPFGRLLILVLASWKSPPTLKRFNASALRCCGCFRCSSIPQVEISWSGRLILEHGAYHGFSTHLGDELFGSSSGYWLSWQCSSISRYSSSVRSDRRS